MQIALAQHVHAKKRLQLEGVSEFESYHVLEYEREGRRLASGWILLNADPKQIAFGLSLPLG